jgi:hypothetical protein
MVGTHEFAAVQLTPGMLVEFAMLRASLGHALPHLKQQIRGDPLLPKLKKVPRAHHAVEHLPERLFAIWRVERGLQAQMGSSVPKFRRTSGTGRIVDQLVRISLVLDRFLKESENDVKAV